MDLGPKAPRLKGVRFYHDINSVTLDLAIDSRLQPNVLKRLDEIYLSGTLRLTFKKLAPNNPKLFGQVQITLIHPWTVNFKFNGILQIVNLLNPALNFLVNWTLCRNYSYILSNPYAQSILNDKRWTTKPVDRVVVIKILLTSKEPISCSCLSCLSPLTFLSKGDNRSMIKLTGSPSKIYVPYNSDEEIIIESLRTSLSKACRFKNIRELSLVLDLRKHYQGPVNVESNEAHIWTEIQPLQSSIVCLKVIEIKCLDGRKIKPLIILRLTGQSDIQHTSFGLDSLTWTFNQEFQFLIKNDFTDKLIFDLVNLNECKKKVSEEDPKSLDDFLASVVTEENVGSVGHAIIRLNDQKANEGDKYMELDLGNYSLTIIFNLHCPVPN